MFRANYKTVTGQVIEIEFQHDFDSQSTIINQARNLTHNIIMYQLYVGYLIYSSIQELQVV